MRRADVTGAGPVDPEGLPGQPHPAAPPRAARRVFRGPSSVTGVVIGLLFMAASLVPALLPRPWYVQGGLSGMAIAVGYGTGSLAALVWHRLRRRPTGPLSPRTVYLAAAAPVPLVIWMAIIHLRWQTDIRVLMNMEGGAGLYLTFAILSSVALGTALVLTGRGIVWLFRRLLRLLTAVMPRPLGFFSMGVAVLIGVIVFFDLVVAGRLVPALEAAHQSSDRRFDPGVEPPDSEVRSGSAGSLMDWERMGRQGRVFVRRHLRVISWRRSPASRPAIPSGSMWAWRWRTPPIPGPS